MRCAQAAVGCALPVDELQHRIGELVRRLRAAPSRKQTRQALLLEGRHRLIERYPRKAKCLGRRRDRRPLHPHTTQHLVLDQYPVVRIEELAVLEEGILYLAGSGVQRCVLPQGLAFAVLSLVHDGLLSAKERVLMELCHRQAERQ